MTFSFWIRLNLRFSAVWLSGGQEAAVSREESLTSLEIARLYSKEIEYSEENMEAVNEELLFSDMFDTQRLSDMVSAVFGSSYLI